MQILVVESKTTRNEFLNVVEEIYKSDLHYVRPLDVDIEKIFNPRKNVYYKHGSAIRFILKNEDEVIGRIAAYVNEKKAYGFDQPTGGIGFFECIDDKDAAFMLFDAAVEWLKEKGMEAADGPINFGENDNFWGLLVEGFKDDPTYGMQYNPPYYQEFYKAYGFQNYFEQVTNRLDLKKPFPERFWKIAEWIGNKPDYEFKHFTWDKKGEYIQDMVEVYNDAWKFHENFTPLSREKVEPSFDQAKPIAIEELLWFAYFKGEPIGFVLMYPDVNQIFKSFNGKLNFINKLRFLWLKRKNTMTRLRVVILGVKTKYQKSGVESGLFYHLREPVFSRTWFNEMELSWVGDFNPKMRALQDSMGAEFSKRHITYRLIFDENKRKNVRATSIPRDSKEKEAISK